MFSPNLPDSPKRVDKTRVYIVADLEQRTFRTFLSLLEVCGFVECSVKSLLLTVSLNLHRI
jgi:hypothetical protein